MKLFNVYPPGGQGYIIKIQGNIIYPDIICLKDKIYI